MTHFVSLLLEKGGLGLVYPGRNHVLTENVELFFIAAVIISMLCLREDVDTWQTRGKHNTTKRWRSHLIRGFVCSTDLSGL